LLAHATGMKIISFIEEESLIKKILKHLNLWMPDKDPPNHSPPQHILELINTNTNMPYKQNTIVGMSTGNTLITTYAYHDDNKETRDYIPQMPFEDEFSQAGSMDEQWSGA
jgi:hypothetical protein